MKTFSVLKAIASGFIWGLGQLLNKQFFKALFFFLFFAAFVTIELATSKYFVKTDAFDRLLGDDFGDDWFQGFYDEYAFESFDYPAFNDFIDEIGGSENLTELNFLSFLAKDLKEHNPSKFTNLATNAITLAEDMTEDRTLIQRRGTLYLTDDGKFYVEQTFIDDIGESRRHFVRSTLFRGTLDETDTINSVEGLTVVNKTGNVYRFQGNYYIRTIFTDSDKVQTTKYINIATDTENPDFIFANAVAITLVGPLYQASTGFYEYFEPGIIEGGVRLQYKETPFTRFFRQSMYYTFGRPGVTYTASDYTRLMIRVYFELNPEIKDAFVSDFNNFFYDRAGFFVNAYWSVITLGTTYKVDLRGHTALVEALHTGPDGGDFNIGEKFNILHSVPILGHVSTQVLLDGLIGVITSLIFFVFMIWSIMDAYRVSEAKRLSKEVLSDKEYFKEIYENGFEYIVLSPAMIVLAFISIMPIVFGFVIAFTNISGNESLNDTFNWVGLSNFINLFNFSSGLGSSFGQAFWRVLAWTVVWAIFSTLTVFFGGFFQALILNSERVVFRKLWRTILILPWAIPALLSQMIFAVIFNENGFVNEVLRNVGVYKILTNLGMLGGSPNDMSFFQRLFYLGAENIQWFSNPFNPTFVRATLIVVNIWLGFPYFMALMTGIMTAIDKTLYEAADIDGATKWQQVRLITMPLVLYSTAPILIMTFSGNFNNFGVIYFITGGGPNAGHYARGFAGDTDILISWLYKLTVEEHRYNIASVFSVLIFMFVGSITAWNLSRTRAFQED